jgi:hypothetical protein
VKRFKTPEIPDAPTIMQRINQLRAHHQEASYLDPWVKLKDGCTNFYILC